MGYVIYTPEKEVLPNIQIEGESREWILTFPFDNVVNYVVGRMVLDNERNPEQSTKFIPKEKDRDLIIVAIRNAASRVYETLARRMLETPEFTSNSVKFTLTVGENHDDNAANMLHMRISEYLQKSALLEFANGDINALNQMLNDIRSLVHYRKHPILRPVRNIL